MRLSNIGVVLCVLAVGCAVTPEQILGRESSAVRAAVPNGTSLDAAQERMAGLGYKCTKTIADAPTTWTSYITCLRRVEYGFPSCAVEVQVKSSYSQVLVEGLQIWASPSCE
jgi:hypothetical protein